MPERECKQAEILKYHRKHRHILVVIVFADIYAVEEYLALGRIVKTAEELDEGRFSAAVHADDGKLFAYPEFQADVPQSIAPGVRVFERNIAEFDVILIVVPLFDRQRAPVHIVRNIKIGKITLCVSVVDKRELHGAHDARNCGKKQHDGRNILRDRADGHSAAERRTY